MSLNNSRHINTKDDDGEKLDEKKNTDTDKDIELNNISNTPATSSTTSVEMESIMTSLPKINKSSVIIKKSLPKSKISLNQEMKHNKKHKNKKKRVRTVMTQLQLRALGNVFSCNKFPSTEIREEIARSIKMPPRSVQIWFQNQRQKHRISKMTNENPWRGLDLLAEAAEIMYQKDLADKSFEDGKKS